MKSVKKFTCKICNKNYKSKQSLCNHNRRFHTNSHQKVIIQSSKSHHLVIKKSSLNNKEDEHKCIYCNKIFSFKQNKYRHMKTCKIKKEKDNNNNYKNKLKLKDAEIKKLKERLRDKMNKN